MNEARSARGLLTYGTGGIAMGSIGIFISAVAYLRFWETLGLIASRNPGWGVPSLVKALKVSIFVICPTLSVYLIGLGILLICCSRRGVVR
jgi:hypothetical protein